MSNTYVFTYLLRRVVYLITLSVVVLVKYFFVVGVFIVEFPLSLQYLLSSFLCRWSIPCGIFPCGWSLCTCRDFIKHHYGKKCNFPPQLLARLL
jgi:hypothetical protein